MKPRSMWRVLLALLVSLCCAGAWAEPLRVLFIGNSYTYYHDMPDLLARLSQGSATPIEARTVTVGGASLEDHLNKGDAQRLLASGRWDWVVLQDHSLRPIDDADGLRRNVRQFGELIRAAGARPMLYVTWARVGSPEKQSVINAAYADAARDIGAKLAPVGQAWGIARRGYTALQLYDTDGSHPSSIGSYLAAYVFHRALLGQAPAAAPPDLSEAQHKALLDISAKAMQQAGVPAQSRLRTPAAAPVH
ncbi:SGNH/GDSL hydrolase family protein [Oxalobacteraceae bacterium OM1]|nr:SGNH/GDSL hydrolase family protein [Oxalobacteraceae bacterium OM1]